MAIKDIENVHKPDILSCLANLSSDEVFTPPNIANDMLDLLPEELFKSPDTKFLDPCCKSGVFLREIAKRLINGLRDKFPTLEECLGHIFKKQLFGISITELTGLLSRRSLYCSRNASGEFSIVQFDDEQGNIRFNRIKHKWNHKKRCEVCGAPQSAYDRGEILETHAYEFIHMNEDKIEELTNMQFDVVIGNPPYQLNLGNDGGNSSHARAIYHLFVSQAIQLNPRYISMIIPSRWMTRTTDSIPEDWINDMINHNDIRVLHDFESSADCFDGVDIKGGINYFLWERDYNGECKQYFHHCGRTRTSYKKCYLNSIGAGIVIRNPNDFPVLNKVIKKEGNYFVNSITNFSSFVSPKNFFDKAPYLKTNWKGFMHKPTEDFFIKFFCNKKLLKSGVGYVAEYQVPKNKDTIKLHKVYIPVASGTGMDSQVLGTPFYGEPNSVCSETYLVIGYDPKRHNLTEKQCRNIISYIKTKFFRWLVQIKKKTQGGTRAVYQFVPLQDFNEPWTDEKLYKKYELSDDEIQFIESMIKPME